MTLGVESWWRVIVDAAASDIEWLEDWLLAAGAISITLCDPHADGSDDTSDPRLDGAILEPLPGDTPLWGQVRLVGLFERMASSDAIHEALARNAPPARADYRLEPLADAAWERTWMESFGPMRFGTRLWVCPFHVEPPDPSAIVVRLDPGLAFGTGTHPTTALCLDWLGDHAETFVGAEVIDYGCGSGILAIAAARLGAAGVHALDIDPQALAATAENARRNDVATRVRVAGIERPPAPADLLLANILYNPLIELADRLVQLVRPGGRLILAGMLDHQTRSLMARYDAHFTFEPVVSREGWARLVGCRDAD